MSLKQLLSDMPQSLKVHQEDVEVQQKYQENVTKAVYDINQVKNVARMLEEMPGDFANMTK